MFVVNEHCNSLDPGRSEATLFHIRFICEGSSIRNQKLVQISSLIIHFLPVNFRRKIKKKKSKMNTQCGLKSMLHVCMLSKPYSHLM